MPTSSQLIICHIKKARFTFEDKSKYQNWKRRKNINFEFDANKADDHGDAVLQGSREDRNFKIDLNPKFVDIAEYHIELGK
ncbi:hypothetical protein OAN307_c13570 [Octadecabacter antarcticus 307]|uniref:Uncharacterized protein n=1 Tax=Octadecabacter antarcticus 307 TaxID=391626 RepID=M9R352_9RHOB|nr:hypothetical protein [Octadecabacter antarcticus]AGI67039.1 hypothetical protein OAN307_c13570 [Octadecabacter antarcticus 307]